MDKTKNINIEWEKLTIKEKDFLAKKKGELQDRLFKTFGENKALRFYSEINLRKLGKFNQLNEKVN